MHGPGPCHLPKLFACVGKSARSWCSRLPTSAALARLPSSRRLCLALLCVVPCQPSAHNAVQPGQTQETPVQISGPGPHWWQGLCASQAQGTSTPPPCFCAEPSRVGSPPPPVAHSDAAPPFRLQATRKAATHDDKRLKSTLNRLNCRDIPAIEEVNLFKEDGGVIHFVNPKVQASIAANTYVVSGNAETKSRRTAPSSADSACSGTDRRHGFG